MGAEGQIPQITLRYDKVINGKTESVQRVIKFDGNYRFSIYDSNDKKTADFEGEYTVHDGHVWRNGQIFDQELNLPTAIASQLIGMSNVEYGENGYVKDYTYTKGDFSTIENDCREGYVPGKDPNDWSTSNAVNTRFRTNVGTQWGVDGYYKANENGMRTSSQYGTVSVWLQQ